MNTIEQIKDANRKAGRFFFEPETLRFFRSRISQAVCPLPNGAALFMTSEQFVASNGWKAPRKWSLRLAKPDGDIDSVGDFQAFNSRGAALRMMQKLADWCRR